MKKRLLLTIAAVLCCAMTMFAQTQNKISYQAVVRNADNHLVVNTPLTVEVTLTDASNHTYSESHSVTSNTNGLISLNIGAGENTSGNWNDIQWYNASVTTKIYLQTDGTLLGTTTMPLTAVPYAKYADLADSAIHAGHSTSADFSDSVSITWLENYLSGSNISTQQQSDWLQTNTEAVDFIKNKPTLATVATSGSYNDLTDKPNKAALCDSVSDCINNSIEDALDDYVTEDALDIILDNYATKVELAGELADVYSKAEVNAKLDEKADVADLADVATSGNYNDLTNKPNKADLCDSVSDCVNASITTALNDYATTAYVDGELAGKADATDLADLNTGLDALKTRVNTFNTHICDSISSCMTSYTAAAQAALQLQLQDYATKAKVKQDSIDLGALIDQNRTDITNLNSDLDKLAERVDTNNKHICDSVKYCVAGWIHDSITNNIAAQIHDSISNITIPCNPVISCVNEALTDGSSETNHAIDTIATNVANSVVQAYAAQAALILQNYEKKVDLCKDVKECIKDTLSYYTTTAGLNNLLNTKADATDLDALKTRVNTFNTHICDSISSCMTSYTAAAQAALQLQLQDYATKAKVKQDSIYLRALIDQNRTDITNLNSDLDKLAERVDTNNKHICDSVEACVTGWIHDSIEDLKKSDNYFSGNNIFGHDQQGEGTEPTITSFGGVVYVPSAEIDLKNTPYEDRCGTATFDQAVNVCDLLAVFDSLNRSIKGVYDSLKKTIDSLKERIAILENASSDVPPVGNILDLDTVTVNHVVADGWTITGTLDVTHHPVKISIADEATVTLKNVTINGVNSSSYAWAGITCEGDATLILNGTNTVKGFYEDYPGLYVKATTNPFEDKTLTINGPGSLTVSSNGCCSAGIGGGYNIECGNIVILGGTINATGGSNAAGIGSSQGGVAGRCGNITIEGGSITATGGSESGAAGIGCGDSGRCGDITITDGVTKVVATKGNDAAPTFIGKGVGSTSACGTVKICGNTFIGGVTTSSSESVPSSFSYSYTGNTWTLTK